MKRLIIPAGLTAAVLLAFVDPSLSASVTFTGIVDEIRGHPSGVAIGDTFSGIFSFHPNPPDTFGEFGGQIDRYSIRAGEFTISGTRIDYGGVEFLTDPSKGAVLYQLFPNVSAPLSGQYALLSADVVLQAGTPGGVIPPLDRFNLNDFGVGLRLAKDPALSDSFFGHLTSFPTFNLNQVPDEEASITLLTGGLLSLAVFWVGVCRSAARWLRASGSLSPSSR
jgi:hypothetical protein